MSNKPNTFIHTQCHGKKLQSPMMQNKREIFNVDVFIDLPNIWKSLERAKCTRADYSVLVRIVVREFVKRLGLTFDLHTKAAENHTLKPIVVCRAVYCFGSIIINCHPDDLGKVAGHRRFITALRRRHGFQVEQVKLNCRRRRLPSDDTQKKQTSWLREKGVDMTLGMRLLQRCMAPDHPDGIVIIAGDADYKPVLKEVTTRYSPVRGTVAAFSKALSQAYWKRKNKRSWEKPIVLDKYISELKSANKFQSSKPSLN